MDNKICIDRLASPELDTIKKNIPLYRIEKMGKEYDAPGEKVVIFRDITINILPEETIAIMGASGCGKSSFLHILGTLATPSWGNIFFQGQNLIRASNGQKALLRNSSIGFVFQFHHLLPEFNTLENVAMPGIIAGMARDEAYARAHELLCQVGLKRRESFNVTLLSGGERQRAAIARAIFTKPKILLADEPTGNLDEKNGLLVADLLLELNITHKMAMVVVTHNPDIATRMRRCFELKSGDLYDQTR